MDKDSRTLIIIDIQNDFCPGGALEVKEGDKIIPLVNSLMGRFKSVIGTQDWHPKDHMSFASNHEGTNVFEEIEIDGQNQTLWPDHCVQGSHGAMFHPQLSTDRFSMIVRKGFHKNIDSYSAFQENDRKTVTGLHGYLQAIGSKRLYLCGLATDYCVLFSALDAADFGFDTTVIIDACKGIDVPIGSIDNAVDKMKKKGIKIIESNEL